MNLCIDIGNSFIKLAIFDSQDQLLFFKREKKILIRDLKDLSHKFGFEKVIISTVRKKLPRFSAYLKSNYKFHILSHQSKLLVKNKYETPKTLGKDRIAAICGAFKVFPKQATLVVDIGTCMTLDFVSKSGNYLGGNISPGANLRLRAMHEFTSSLPLVKLGKTKRLIGKSTSEAIRNGAVYGICTEIESYIRRLEIKYDNINVILTGGDASFFGELIDYKIFVDPNLVLKGLNEILKINL